MRLNLLFTLSLVPLTACADSTLQVEAAGDLQAEMTEIAILSPSFCNGWGVFAFNMMTVRQSGVKLSDVWEFVINHETLKETPDLIMGMAFLAYELPQRRTQEDRVQAAFEFQDEMKSICFEAIDMLHG